jgi:cytochrome c biogenesis protein CcmG, thiol:disulfide interchange protein DsbE
MAKISPLLWATPLLFAGLTGFLAVGLMRDNARAVPPGHAGQQNEGVQPGQEVPPMQLTALGDLPQFDAATLRQPGVKLVNFWASWCVPCRVEHAQLIELSAELPVYGIDYKDETAPALAFLDELSNPFTALGMDEGATGRDWGLIGLPETFVINSEGVVVLRYTGPITQKVLKQTIRPAIAAAQ